ncbi:hypothetical protein BH23ACT4_BH23ACT4_03590 [soil metagenome]
MLKFFVPPHSWAFTPAQCDSIVGAVDGWGAPSLVAGTQEVTVATNPKFAWMVAHVMNVAVATNGVLWDRSINQLQKLQIIRYPAGAALFAHCDDLVSCEPAGFDQAASVDGTGERTVSVVGQLSDPDSYEGGRLVFTVDGGQVVVPVDQGTLAVFGADIVHEVRKVVSGDRYSFSAFFTRRR